MNRFTTDLTVTIGGYEKTFPVVVEYWHHKAHRGGHGIPSYPECVEIGSVYALVDGEEHPLLSQYAIEAMIPDLHQYFQWECSEVMWRVAPIHRAPSFTSVT